MTTPFYKTVPALKQYIDRIGAKPSNFLRYVVREEIGNYYRELCVIKLSREGHVTVTDPTYQPTEAEQQAIKQAFVDRELPRSIEVRPAGVQDLLPMMREMQNGEPIYFEFYNQRTGNVIMVQQRINLPDGGKRYVPWSYWNDGIWRCMEPDHDLPFWKPKQSTHKSKIMVHEGAKAAAAAQAIADDPESTHPWAEELRQFEHWGMIGGAHSPHRTDYQELWDRNLDLMVYVCDNDAPGRAAAPLVSKHYKRRMARVNFDASWPEHFDLADPMPRGIKKRMKDCMRSCTWATEEFAVTPKRTAFKVSKAFADEWSTSTIPDAYIHNDLPRKLFDADQFNKWVRPYSDVEDTAKLLRRKEECLAAGLRYDPSSKSGRAVGGYNADFINTYMPPEIKPKAGDVSPFLDYLEHVFPSASDRNEVVRWCATLVCRPSVKMKYGMLLISETQGVGKSTLGSDILQPLVGEWNYSQPEAKTVCESSFNGWCAHKRLIVIHEVHEDYNSKGYERLKSTITEASFEVNEKYQKPYRIDNWAHVIACSNNKKALKLGMEDRRWLVPKVREQKRSAEEWRAFHAWLKDGGLQHILWWFEEWLRNNDMVFSGNEAPFTEAKQDVVRENYSAGLALVADELERLKEAHPGKSLIVLDFDLQTMVKNHLRPDKLESAARIRRVAKQVDWFVNERRVQIRAWQRAGAGRMQAITNDASLAAMPIEALEEMVTQGRALFVDASRPTF